MRVTLCTQNYLIEMPKILKSRLGYAENFIFKKINMYSNAVMTPHCLVAIKLNAFHGIAGGCYLRFRFGMNRANGF